jgi:hypothetical protein
LDVVVSVCPVALAKSLIVAPGTTAPVGSFTSPRSEVVAFCAKLAAVKRDRKRTSTDTPMRLIKSFLQRDNSLTSPKKREDKDRDLLMSGRPTVKQVKDLQFVDM